MAFCRFLGLSDGEVCRADVACGCHVIVEFVERNLREVKAT